MTTMQSKGQSYHSRKKAYCLKISDKMRKRVKRAWPKRHADMAERDLDEDTLHWRFLQDRKGKPIAWPDLQLRHSMRRTDSYDLLQNGTVVKTGGRRAIGLYLASLLP